MKICLAYSDSLGGWQSFNFNMANGFVAKGHEVWVLIFNSAGNIQHVLANRVRVICIKKRINNEDGLLADIVSLINSIDPDVILNSDVDYIQAAFPYIKNGTLRIPVIHSVALHEMKKVLVNEGWWHIIVAVAPLVARELQCLSPQVRVTTIPIGINTAENQNRIDRSMGEHPLKICYVGRLELVDKNVAMITRCALYLRSLGVKFEWNIVGDGGYQLELQRNLDSVGLRTSFNFLGILEKSALQKLLASQHILVMPSLYEGTPHAILEAMLSGVVPVVSDIPGATSEIIENEKDGYLFNVTDPASCAMLIKMLDDNRELLEQLSKNAVNKIKQKFSLEQTVDSYLKLFNQIRNSAIPLNSRLHSRPTYPQEFISPYEKKSAIRFMKNLIIRGAKVLKQ